MFSKLSFPTGCRKYEARLEDYLQGTPDAALEEHLTHCARCTEALEDSRMAGELIRQAWEPANVPRPAFLASVVSRIRDEEIRASSPSAFWSPLEFLASRLSMTAAVLLLALSVYIVGFAPTRPAVAAHPNRTELSASDFPQPPGDPDSNEEVLVSLAERHYGR